MFLTASVLNFRIRKRRGACAAFLFSNPGATVLYDALSGTKVYQIPISADFSHFYGCSPLLQLGSSHPVWRRVAPYRALAPEGNANAANIITVINRPYRDRVLTGPGHAQLKSVSLF